MWWRTEPQGVGRVEDRLSSIYVSHARVDRADNGLVFERSTGNVYLPAVMVGALLLGPGVAITHAAVVLLADSGTSVVWVGDQGVRMYAAGLAGTRSARLLLRQAWLVSSPPRRLGVARQMYAMRFPGEDVSSLTMQQLRGREGARVRRVYRANSDRTGVPWRGRSYVAGKPMAAGDDINRLLSAGHACLYGLVHAAVASLGCSPGLGFIHTGNALAFVHDVADLYKADITIPCAFDVASAGRTSEAAVRYAVRDQITDARLLPRVVADISPTAGRTRSGGTPSGRPIGRPAAAMGRRR
jgi:CRISPR-associated protein Cas1